MTYVAGAHLFVCDVCGFEFLSDVKRKRWDGLIVCPDDYETDHPQKYVRTYTDGQAVQDPRPEGPDVFTQPVYCSVVTRTPAANIGVADCLTVDATTTLNYANYGLPNLNWPVVPPSTGGAFWSFSGTPGSTTYTDTGGYGATLANDTAGSALSAFGGGSLEIASDLVGELPEEIALGTGDFEISFDVYFQSSGEALILGLGGTLYDTELTFSLGSFDVSNRGIYARLISDYPDAYSDATLGRLLNNAPTVSTWVGIKFVRMSGTVTLYVNNVVSGSRTGLGVDCGTTATNLYLSTAFSDASFESPYIRNLSITRPV